MRQTPEGIDYLYAPVHSFGFAPEIVCERDGSKMVLVPKGEFDNGLAGNPMIRSSSKTDVARYT